ncbi:hypothetical protein AVEN_128352-1 [Araneus ventricosus]|uniref:Uncharacterized protein n=1 Tax=Araneus ventricosus TaxID=182803 RepID=A0A4Y2DDU1_ARAVE|nr:hypothetical protein AVEN_128352-1 [Araneus ventricosus]
MCAPDGNTSSVSFSISQNGSKVYGSFFFCKKTVTGASYLDMLQLWLFPQLADDYRDFILQQDGAPTEWSIHVRRYLNDDIPHRWIGLIGEDDLVLFPCPPPCPSSFGGTSRTLFMYPNHQKIRRAQGTDPCFIADH